MTQTQNSLAQELLTLAAKRFDKPADGMNVEDDFFRVLGIDSLQAMDLLTEVEERYSIEVPDYELQGVTTFVALADVVQRRIV